MLSLLIEGHFPQLQLFSRTISSWLFCNRKLFWVEWNYAMIDNYPECILHLILLGNLFLNCPKYILFLLLQMIQSTSELFLWCFWDFCYCWEKSEDAGFASFYGTYSITVQLPWLLLILDLKKLHKNNFSWWLPFVLRKR